MERDYGKSLANQKFLKTVEGQIRNYWHIQTSLIYSKRWWDTIPANNLPATLSQFPGDNKTPFSSIDISTTDYVKNFISVATFNRESSIVNVITSYEVYMFDILQRILFLQPELVGKSEMPIEASEIGDVLQNKNVKEWFAKKVANKFLRNLTHLKMMKRMQGILKVDIVAANTSKIEEWNKWTYVRNAIVHNGREVSEDLVRVWPERFKKVGDQLNLLDKDFIVLHSLAISLAKIIDIPTLNEIIKLEDANLLIREIFIKDGIDDSKELGKKIFKILNCKIKAPEVDKALGFQRRTNSKIEGWNFSHLNFLE